FRALDPSRVAMVDLELPRGFFDEYHCPSEVEIGVRLDWLLDVAGRGKAKQAVAIECDGKRLKHEFSGRGGDDGTGSGGGNEGAGQSRVKGGTGPRRRLWIPLVSCKRESYSPRFSFTATVKLPASIFEEAIRSLSLWGNAKISVDEKSFKISAGDERGDAEVDLSQEAISYEVSEAASARYNLAFLSAFVKPSRLADVAIISLSKEMPIKITYPLAAGGVIAYYLAPWVDIDV
ncbi:MAG: hypothetical protein BA066_07840, partial [Candidatus Korarchaeota archaeon NZ13-K]